MECVLSDGPLIIAKSEKEFEENVNILYEILIIFFMKINRY